MNIKKYNYVSNNIYKSLNSNVSKSTIITFNNKVIKQTRVPTRRSLHIGINYTDTEQKLRGCINDANNISNLIKSPIYGFKDKDILIISDDTTITPTRDNIISLLINLMQNTQSGDILFFSFSGHGLKIDLNDENNTDTCLLSYDLKFITDSELKQIINTYLPKGVNLFALIDACYSGTVFNLKYQYLNSLNNNDNDTYLTESETKGQVVMISGSTDIQTSADSPIKIDDSGNKIYEGAMTWSFIKTLENIKKPTWYELITNMRLYLTTSEKGYTQIPQLSAGKPLNMENICSFNL
jgi:hypothetical protein